MYYPRLLLPTKLKKKNSYDINSPSNKELQTSNPLATVSVKSRRRPISEDLPKFTFVHQGIYRRHALHFNRKPTEQSTRKENKALIRRTGNPTTGGVILLPRLSGRLWSICRKTIKSWTEISMKLVHPIGILIKSIRKQEAYVQTTASFLTTAVRIPSKKDKMSER